METQETQIGKGLEKVLDRSWHAHVQSEAVFSYAMTIMDAMYGWEDEQKRVGSKFAACMWIYTQEVLTRGQILNPEKEEYLKKRIMSIMAMHKLGLCLHFRRSRMGVRKHDCSACGRNDGHGNEI